MSFFFVPFQDIPYPRQAFQPLPPSYTSNGPPPPAYDTVTGTTALIGGNIQYNSSVQ